MVSDTLHYGRGAGKLPTASAVVADIIEFGQNVNVPYMRPWEVCDDNVVIDRGEYVRKYFVRLKGDISNADVAKNIDIVAFEKLFDGEVAFVTNDISYNQLNSKLALLGLNAVTIIEIKA